MIMPLATLADAVGPDRDVTSVIVQVDSVDNLDATVSALAEPARVRQADVVSDTTTTADTLSSLNNIKHRRAPTA